jgi:CheY-like chemotaxis protein
MKRILVIDDDVQFRQMLKQTLEREGYEVIDAPDGKEGIKLYRQAATDLVITDLLMPYKEGFETVMELKRDFPDVKIIAISGGSGSRGMDVQDCFSLVKWLGAARTFAKPFDHKELFEAIRELLGSVVVSELVP